MYEQSCIRVYDIHFNHRHLQFYYVSLLSSTRMVSALDERSNPSVLHPAEQHDSIRQNMV